MALTPNHFRKRFNIITGNSVKIGTLVMRGADWGYKRLPDGDLGTVIGIYPNCPKDMCVVKWDKESDIYRIGRDNKYDLYHFNVEEILSGSTNKLIKKESNGKEKAIKVQRTARTVRRSNGTRGAVIRCRASRAKCKGVNI